jgi:Sulfotransferase family
MIEQLVPFDPYLAPFKDEIALLESQTDMAAVEWIVTMNRGLNEINHNPDMFFPVSYEELVANPKQMLHRIFQFLNLRTDPVALKYAVNELVEKPSRKKIDVHPMLKEALSETSVKLGYGVQFSEAIVTE